VAFPTETVYGLGADATNEKAVARIYEVKGRPTDHPLIVHISSMELMDKWASEIPEYAIKLARAFWPGPMTLVLKRTELVKDFITGGQDTVAIRVPSHTLALQLLKEFEAQGGLGVAAPSANRFGAVSPTSVKAVELELGSYLSLSDQILDGGNCEVGIESTIIDCRYNSPAILRPGSVTSEMIQEICKSKIEVSLKNTLDRQIKFSGSLESHYAPKAKLILNRSPKKGDGFIGLSLIETPKGAIRLASPTNNTEFAQVLYEALRIADEKGIQEVIIVTPSNDGIGAAINDRLSRASCRK
jgi:L-threonylcarbamoyladenylate synthase